MKEIDNLYKLFKESSGVSTDTRSLVHGQLFFALKGEFFDAGLFVQKAIDKGAFHIVTQNVEWKGHESVTVVEDVLIALQQLATLHRRTLKTKIIGLTGSNGKTTTKELMFVALAKKYNLFKTEGNYNNHIGVPLSLLSLNEDHELAIIEMGANKPGDIKELSEIAEPDFGLITNIGHAHLEQLGSIEGVFNTKTELYRFLKGVKGHIFVNELDKKLYPYAQDLDVEFSCYNQQASTILPGEGPDFNLEIHRDGKKHLIEPQLFGSFNAQNYICAADVAHYFSVSYEESCKALSDYRPTMMRSQVMHLESYTIFIDAYNANPTSMRASIAEFFDVSEKTCLILGDMKEMGTNTHIIHQEMVDFIQEYSWSRVDLIGPDFSNCKTEFGQYQDVHEFIGQMDPESYRNKLVLLKASRSVKLELTLERFKDA